MTTFGQRFQQLLVEHQETQAELATFLGVKRQTLHNWVKDRREPEYEMLTKIADHFRVSVDYLLGRTNTRQPSPPPDADPIEHLDIWLRGVATKEDIDLIRDLLEVRRKRLLEQQDAKRTD